MTLGEKKSLATPGNRTCVGDVPVLCSTNWTTSPPPQFFTSCHCYDSQPRANTEMRKVRMQRYFVAILFHFFFWGGGGGYFSRSIHVVLVITVATISSWILLASPHSLILQVFHCSVSPHFKIPRGFTCLSHANSSTGFHISALYLIFWIHRFSLSYSIF